MSLRIRGTLPSEWRESVVTSRWYTLSCFSYSFAGAVLLFVCLFSPSRASRLPSLWSGDNHVVYRLLSLLLLLNGVLSYMADVETWGRKSVWKELDVACSTTNLLLQVAIGMRFAHEQTSKRGFQRGNESRILLLHVAGIVLSLVAKRRSVLCAQQGDVDGFLLWHGMWHYTLPLTATLSLLWLVSDVT